MKEMNSAGGSRSFALASVFIPKYSRKRIAELYLWCRKCDDLIDEAPNQETAKKRLKELMAGDTLPDLQPPEWVLSEDREHFLKGLAMDVEGFKYQTLVELELYCFRVAGVIGLMMCPLLGADRPIAAAPAVALGKAMQLTNIARDVQEDAYRGRVYIPAEILNGLDSQVLAREPEKSLEAVQFLLELADYWYEEGFNGLTRLPMWSALGIAVAGTVYRKIGHKLLQNARIDSASAFRKRTVVSNPEKLIAVALAIWLVIRIKILHWELSSRQRKENVSWSGHEQP